MSSQALEQMLENSFAPSIGQSSMYQTIDTYIGGTTHLYSFDPPKPNEFKPIGSQGSGFQSGAQGNIRMDLGNSLQERYDFSRHDNTVHINYDILGAKKDFSAKGLGDAHKIDLSNLFNDKK